DNEEFNEIMQLRQWAMTSNIPHTKLDSLLQILRRRLLPNLPATAKTFLKTNSAEYNIKQFYDVNGCSVGEFVYFGIAKHLQRTVNPEIHENETLYLKINIDGLPLFNSSLQQFWPIPGQLHFEPEVYKPFPIAVYAGREKPNNLSAYLENFIVEINELLLNGIIIDEKSFKVCIMCFVCDRPARSFIKCIKGHVGFYACERCEVRGTRHENRTIYCNDVCEERIDQSFRDQRNPEHHIGLSPLTFINPRIDMVRQFVLDFMHLCYLGIMKKMLVECWMKGNLSTRLNQNSKMRLSQRLMQLKSQIPADFQRSTRSIFEVAKWKATEFRFFLLYCGPIVLKNILSKKLYNHFLLFHVACRILCSNELALKFNTQAKKYLESFVHLARYYYGKQSQTLNMHSLIHLADDVQNMKCCLSGFTAFPFENILGKMKKVLRSGNRPLAQLCRRLHESHFAEEKKTTLPLLVNILKKQYDELNDRVIIKKLIYKNALLSSKSPDNTVFLNNGKILMIDDIYSLPNQLNSNEIEITGILLKIKSPIFTYPCNSKYLNMWEVSHKNCSRITCPLNFVVTKMVTICMHDNEKMYTMPLLHV
ncbi:hypothetical protein ALC57_07643, partial [Trachymyrmex cornetzi]